MYFGILHITVQLEQIWAAYWVIIWCGFIAMMT